MYLPNGSKSLREERDKHFPNQSDVQSDSKQAGL